EKTYIRKKFDGEYEFTSIMGNIAIVDEELIIHCHATITDVEFNAYGGHLFDGKVGPTIELIVLPFKQPMLRSLDQNTGLKLLKL
ncbi:MAG: DNA-binding protein, partial [candidate division WOR-3 bacterium]